MHLAINIFVIFALLAAGWVMFFAWLIGTIIRGVCHGVSRITGTQKRVEAALPGQVRCRRVRCRAMNPPQANFCRRCGSPLTFPATQRQTYKPTSDERWASSPISL
jgi:hypothetical protein